MEERNAPAANEKPEGYVPFSKDALLDIFDYDVSFVEQLMLGLTNQEIGPRMYALIKEYTKSLKSVLLRNTKGWDEDRNRIKFQLLSLSNQAQQQLLRLKDIQIATSDIKEASLNIDNTLLKLKNQLNQMEFAKDDSCKPSNGDQGQIQIQRITRDEFLNLQIEDKSDTYFPYSFISVNNVPNSSQAYDKYVKMFERISGQDEDSIDFIDNTPENFNTLLFRLTGRRNSQLSDIRPVMIKRSIQYAYYFTRLLQMPKSEGGSQVPAKTYDKTFEFFDWIGKDKQKRPSSRDTRDYATDNSAIQKVVRECLREVTTQDLWK